MGRDEQEILPANPSRAWKMLGTWRCCYGLRRMRRRGLAKESPERSRKDAIQVHLTAIACNLKPAMNILAARA